MVDIRVARLYIKFKNSQMSPQELMTEYSSLITNDFDEIDESELNSHEKKHEIEGHGSVYREKNISYKIYRTKKDHIPFVKPDDVEYERYVNSLSKNEFIDFLIEVYSAPEKRAGLSLDGDDEIMNKILLGEVRSEDDILHFRLKQYAKNSVNNN